MSILMPPPISAEAAAQLRAEVMQAASDATSMASVQARPAVADMDALSQVAVYSGIEGKIDFDSLVRSMQIYMNHVFGGVINAVPPAVRRVFQRQSRVGGPFGKGYGFIEVNVDPDMPIARIEYRLVDANSPGAELVPWTQGYMGVTTGPNKLRVSIPAGPYFYDVFFRINGDDQAIFQVAAHVGVGEVVALTGQSLAQNMLVTNTSNDTPMANQGVVGHELASIYAQAGLDPYPAPVTWASSQDGTAYRSTGAAVFLSTLIERLGVPCALVGYAVGSTSYSDWLPGAALFENLKVILREVGDFGTLAIIQGHADARTFVSKTAWREGWERSISDLRDTFQTSADFRLICTTIPTLRDYGPVTPTSVEVIRQAGRELASRHAAGGVVVDGLGWLPMPDGVHPSQAGQIPMARDLALAWLGLFGYDPHGEAGPKVVETRRELNSDTIDVVWEPNGGTSLTKQGSGIDQFKVVASDAVTEIPISTITFDNTSQPRRIRLKLSSKPADNEAQFLSYRPYPDTEAISDGGIFDNLVSEVTDRPRRLRMFDGPRLVAAPSGYGGPTIPNPLFAFHADKAGCMWRDLAATQPATSSQFVRCLTDLTGGNTVFQQEGDESRLPVLIGGVTPTGRRGLLFNSRLLQMLQATVSSSLPDAMRNAGQFTVLLVTTPTALPLVSDLAAAGFYAGGSTSSTRIFDLRPNGSLRARMTTPTGGFETPDVTAAVQPGTLLKTILRFPGNGLGNQARWRINSRRETFRTVPTVSLSDPWTSATIGAEIDRYYLDGYLHELRIWGHSTDATTTDALMTYAANEWGNPDAPGVNDRKRFWGLTTKALLDEDDVQELQWEWKAPPVSTTAARFTVDDLQPVNQRIAMAQPASWPISPTIRINGWEYNSFSEFLVDIPVDAGLETYRVRVWNSTMDAPAPLEITF